MRADELLVLHYDELHSNLEQLLTDLSQSASHREFFLKDPVRYLARAAVGDDLGLSTGEISVANRLLFAMLSNGEFMSWGRRFQRELRQRLDDAAGVEDPTERERTVAALVDSREVRQRLAEGLRDHADLEAIFTLLDLPRVPMAGTGTAAVLPLDRPYAETFVLTDYIVVAYAYGLFIVALTQIDVGPVPPTGADQAVSRLELQRLSGSLADRLQRRAVEARASGALTGFNEV